MTRSEKLALIKDLMENLCGSPDATEILIIRLRIKQELQECVEAVDFKLMSTTIDILLNDIERYSLQKLQGIDFPVDARSAGAAVDAICQLVLESGVGFFEESRERLVS